MSTTKPEREKQAANRDKNGRFVKGESGNPAGRPPSGHALTDILREAGELTDVKIGKRKLTRKEALARRLWEHAMAGNVMAAKLIFERLDGRVPLPVEHSGTDGDPIEIVYSELFQKL